MRSHCCSRQSFERRGSPRHRESDSLAVFDADSPTIAAILEANGIDAEEGQIILRREIAASGKAVSSSTISRRRSASSNNSRRTWQ